MRIIQTTYEHGVFMVVVEVNGFYGTFKGDETIIEALLEVGFTDDR